ncbi:MarR family winged helix-turn-helix transcriptional regulator [Cellulosimicrobium sp. CUA-896]|uniref:MarR family winged helix-turn-helix transcriptional regulator n=1 Tax=Cellulosimicrobium sp. CUA-896 TaxID=1517881 RepID=UPI000AC0E1B4
MSTESPPTVVDEMVCFSLYAAARATTQAYRALLAPWDLTYPQYLVLVDLWTQDRRTVSELGRCLGLDSGTLSPLLRRMEQAGLLVRVREDADERVVVVRLTERGVALRDELGDVPRRVYEGMGLDVDEARRLRDAVHGLTDGMRAVTASVRHAG